MNLLRSIKIIINYKTFIVTALAITATAICHYYNYTADMPLTLIGIAIVFPILYAPYFALLALEFPNGFAYLLPVIFSFVLVSLDNIQVHLENPFDQIGEDDIRLDVEDHVALIGG